MEASVAGENASETTGNTPNRLAFEPDIGYEDLVLLAEEEEPRQEEQTSVKAAAPTATSCPRVLATAATSSLFEEDESFGLVPLQSHELAARRNAIVTPATRFEEDASFGLSGHAVSCGEFAQAFAA